VGVSWLMEVFEIDGINIYKVDTKLQAADIGAERIACVATWRSNSEPGVDATGQRALSSQLRRDIGQAARTRAGSSAGARGGSFESKLRKKKRVTTNKVVYDDPATHSRLCCGEYDTDCEPAYPCGDFQEVDM
jgi:hypothetical protein